MDLLGCNGFVPEFKIARSTGILNNHALKSEIKSGPDGGIDAHVAHGTGDDHFVHLLIFQFLEKRGFPEAVRIMFLNDLFIRNGLDAIMNLGSLRVRQKKGRTFVNR